MGSLGISVVHGLHRCCARQTCLCNVYPSDVDHQTRVSPDMRNGEVLVAQPAACTDFQPNDKEFVDIPGLWV